MEVPHGPVLCLTAEGAEKFALAILEALEAAGLRKPPELPGAAEVTQALIAGTLGIVENGLAVPENGEPKTAQSLADLLVQTLQIEKAEFTEGERVVDKFPLGCFVVPVNNDAARNMLVEPGTWASVVSYEAGNLVVRWERDGIERYHPADWFRRV
jgi:hypothetical protein